MFLYPEPVTVLTPGTLTDPYSGETVATWATSTSRAESCGVAPAGSTEPNILARTPIDSGFDLIFDHDPGITVRDRVVVRGLTCDVTGRPFLYRSPLTGWTPGTVARVTIREG